METTRGAKGVAHSLSAVSVCPAYRFCRELKRSYRSPVFDEYHDQQVTILRDLLQAIKEAALRLSQLIEKRRQIEHREPERCERTDQLGSEMVLSTSSSVCALCGIALHLRNPSREFVLDGEIIHPDRDVTLKDLESILPVKIPYKAASPTKTEKIGGDVVVHESVFDPLFSEGNGSRNVGVSAREQKKLAQDPKLRPADASEKENLKSKLIFVRIPSDKIPRQIRPREYQRRRDNATQVLEHAASEHEYKAGEASILTKVTHQSPKMASLTISSDQDASTLTHEMFCPCSCGLLAGDEPATSRVSIESLRAKLIKTKLEELGLHLPAKKERARERTKPRDDVRMMKKIRAQKLKKDKKMEQKQDVMQLQLQAQVEELHRNIRFFREENEYIRRLVEQCRYSAETTGGLRQLLPTRLTYSGLMIAIRLLRAKYCSTHGIIATLAEMVSSSLIIQRITEIIFAPFADHRSPHRSSAATSHAQSVSEVEAFLRTSSSTTFGVY